LLSHTAAHGSKAAALGSYSSFYLVLSFSALHSPHHVVALIVTTMTTLLCSPLSLSLGSLGVYL